MAEKLPVGYVVDVLNEMISNGKGNIDIMAEVDEENWLMSLRDVIGENEVSQQNGVVEISAHEVRSEDGVMLERLQGTGGRYADIEQVIALEATLEVGEENGETFIPQDGNYKLNYFCEVEAKNGHTVRGEQPPF